MGRKLRCASAHRQKGQSSLPPPPMHLPLACEHNLRDATWAMQPSPTLVALASFSHFPMFPQFLFLLSLALLFPAAPAYVPIPTYLHKLLVVGRPGAFLVGCSRMHSSIELLPRVPSHPTHRGLQASEGELYFPIPRGSSLLLLSNMFSSLAVSRYSVYFSSPALPPRSFLFSPLSVTPTHITILPYSHLLTLASPTHSFFAAVHYCLARSHHTHTTAQPVSVAVGLSSLSTPLLVSCRALPKPSSPTPPRSLGSTLVLPAHPPFPSLSLPLCPRLLSLPR
jgi:hypothetical protein